MKKLEKRIDAKEFDAKFDRGEDITPYLDMKSVKVRHAVQRINIDLPVGMLDKADREAARIGVPRTSLFKMWIAEHLDHLATKA